MTTHHSSKKKIHHKKSILDEMEKEIIGFRAKLETHKKWSDRVADWFTKSFGTVWFFILNAIFFLIWIGFNTGFIPGLPVFDPFPYGLLTMIVSLLAIFLSVIVLISQNRASTIAELREELDLHINVRAEEEITKILNLLDEIRAHLGLTLKRDTELHQMKQKTDIEKIKQDLMKEIQEGV